MKILVPAFFVLSLSTGYAQQTINSLDLALPPFTPQERAILITIDGLYFSKTTFAQNTVSGFMYKGSGGVSGSTTVGEDYSFYIGSRAVPWDTYFDRIGLRDYANQYNKVKRERSLMFNLGLVGLTIGTTFGGLGFMDLALGNSGEYMLGSSDAALMSGIFGTMVAVVGAAAMLTMPGFPPGPSDEYLITISNEENRKKLR